MDAMIYQFTWGFIWDLIPRERSSWRKKDTTADGLEFGYEPVFVKVPKAKKSRTSSKQPSHVAKKRGMKEIASSATVVNKKNSEDG